MIEIPFPEKSKCNFFEYKKSCLHRSLLTERKMYEGMLLPSFFRKNKICSNHPKSLIIVHKSNDICKKCDFAMEQLFLIKLHHLPVTLISQGRLLKLYNSFIFNPIFA